MNANPFLSNTFATSWLHHFKEGKKVYLFNFFSPVTFIRHSLLPLYYNVGATNTKGIEYQLKQADDKTQKGKTIVLYDIPDHAEIDTSLLSGSIGHYRVPQYSGYRCSFDDNANLSSYMSAVISKKSRSKFLSYKRKLENDYTLTYKMYRNDISDATYTALFQQFNHLLEKRFTLKKTTNNNLHPEEWNFYKEVSLLLMRSNKAGLFVVEANGQPIAITLLYFSDTIAYDVIRTFDIDFARYRPGNASIMEQVTWCINNGFSFLDFSKGHFEYKQRWANHQYKFEYHIYYDKKSILAILIAFSLKVFFAFKQFLRSQNINAKWHRLQYLFKRIAKRG